MLSICVRDGSVEWWIRAVEFDLLFRTLVWACAHDRATPAWRYKVWPQQKNAPSPFIPPWPDDRGFSETKTQQSKIFLITIEEKVRSCQKRTSKELPTASITLLVQFYLPLIPGYRWGQLELGRSQQFPLWRHQPKKADHQATDVEMMNKRLVLSNCSLSYQQWGSHNSAKKVLAIHGWLDNSNSFSVLGPYLAERGYHVVAYDNIGHGYSSHETASSNSYTMAPYLGRCRDMIERLQWDKCSIVGHSLGASLTTLFAGTHPEIVEKIVLIDGFVTPTTQPAERAASNLRRAIDSERKYNIRQLTKSGPKSYPTLQDAISARLSSVATYPGKQFLSVEAASMLVAR